MGQELHQKLDQQLQTHQSQVEITTNILYNNTLFVQGLQVSVCSLSVHNVRLPKQAIEVCPNLCLVSLSWCVHCRSIGLLQRGHGGGDEAVQFLPVTRLQEPLVELDLHQLLELTLLLPGGQEGEETETQQR